MGSKLSFYSGTGILLLLPPISAVTTPAVKLAFMGSPLETCFIYMQKHDATIGWFGVKSAQF